MCDERMLHGPCGQESPHEHDRGQEPTVTEGRPRRRFPGDRLAVAHQPDRHDDDAGDAGDEGEPDADGAEVGVEHQCTVPFFARTRLGCWAM